MSLVVFTGGPGAGKTTVLLALKSIGYTVVGDSARTIIQDRRQRGLSPRPNAYEFAQEVLRRDVENYASHASAQGPVFFDRSALDALCMLDLVTPLNELELSLWLSRCQYSSKVFLFPPWRAIFANDNERDQTFEQAESVNRSAQEWYRKCQYQVLEVPKVSVSQRCAYVLQALESSDA
jgi:predicted ATPase